MTKLEELFPLKKSPFSFHRDAHKGEYDTVENYTRLYKPCKHIWINGDQKHQAIEQDSFWEFTVADGEYLCAAQLKDLLIQLQPEKEELILKSNIDQVFPVALGGLSLEYNPHQEFRISETVKSDLTDLPVYNIPDTSVVKVNYEPMRKGTLEEYFECYNIGKENSFFEFINGEQEQKVRETEKFWILQWYPRTPIGFYCLASYDLELLLLESMKESKPVPQKTEEELVKERLHSEIITQALTSEEGKLALTQLMLSPIHRVKEYQNGEQ